MTDSQTKVVITAAASGIGLAIAKRFANMGAQIAICDIDTALLDSARQEINPRYCATCDVSDAAAMAQFIDQAASSMDGINTVVANAGSAGPTALLENVTPEEWNQTLAVNLTGQFNLLHGAIPHLKQNDHGAVILMSSAAGRLGIPMRSPYCAAKWGVIGLKETLAMELGEFGITVNAILPGSVEGPRMDSVFNLMAVSTGLSIEKVKEKEIANVSMRRMIHPDEIADLAAYLASSAARSISGQSIGVCGNFETLR